MTPNKIIVSLLFVMLFSQCIPQQRLVFFLIDRENHLIIDEGTRKPYLADFYIVKNYRNNSTSQKQIDSLAFQLGEHYKGKYTSYVIQFYKFSTEKNLINLKKDPKNLEDYSEPEDYIYSYSWSSGKFLGRFKYENGKVVEPKEGVILSDPVERP